MRRLSRRTLAVALVAVAVTAGATFVAGAVGAPTPDSTASDAVDGPAVRQTDTSGAPADRLECTNGTSEAVVACGYSPGPTSVSLADGETTPGTVTVEAVELNDGGFVALHRVSFVDGAFTDSVVGVSQYLSPGLHRDVQIAVNSTIANRTIAVVYRDTDDDERFDFVTTGGATDRPYTNTYTESGGNVTDEAGDVIGDVATVETAPDEFDSDGDGRIDIGELGDAASAYASGKISIRRLGRAAAAYASGS